MKPTSRLYDLKGAARCARCQGPMVQLDGHRVHPTCEPEFRSLKSPRQGGS